MKLYKEINYGFEKEFREALENHPEDFRGFNDLVKAFINLNSENKNSRLNTQKITIPIVFHIVWDRPENNLSYEAIKKIIGQLNSFYNKFDIKFKPATRDPKGNVLREFGIVRHNWRAKIFKQNISSQYTAMYRNHGVGIPDQDGNPSGFAYNISSLKKELNWDTRQYLNIYLVNVIRGERFTDLSSEGPSPLSGNPLVEVGTLGIPFTVYEDRDAKYSHITNSVTAEINDDFESFGIVIPFYALPKEDLNYHYIEQPLIASVSEYSNFDGVLGYFEFQTSDGEVMQYGTDPIVTDNGNYISIIHAVAVSLNLLSLFSTRYEKGDWLDSCGKTDESTYDGNKFSGDGCLDTPHLLADDYLRFRYTNVVDLKCKDKYGEKQYDGSNLMAHPYFVDNEFGENILIDLPAYSLTTEQVYRIRANFFLFVDGSPTIWNSLSHSTKADPVQGYDDSDTQSDKKGCTDPLAINYNPYAGIDDGSCKYIESDPDYSDEDVVDDDPIIGDPCEETFIDNSVAIPSFSKTIRSVYRNSIPSTPESLLDSFKNFLRIQQVINSIL